MTRPRLVNLMTTVAAPLVFATVGLTWGGSPYLNDIGNVVDQLVAHVNFLEDQTHLPNLPGGDIEQNISDMLDYMGDVFVYVSPTSSTSAWVYINTHINMTYNEHLNIMVILTRQFGSEIVVNQTRHITSAHFTVHITNIRPGIL